MVRGLPAPLVRSVPARCDEMPKVFLSIFLGTVVAMVVFLQLVSGKSDVTLHTWKGMLVLFLIGMGSVWCCHILVSLVLNK